MTKLTPRPNERHRGQLRLSAWLCCCLGLLWAFGPILHAVVHVAQVPHRHASGSVHEHDNSGRGLRGHSHDGHRHGHSHHDHDSRDHRSGEGEDDRSRPSEPADDSQIFFFSLDVAASENVATEVVVGVPSPSSDSLVCESPGFSSATVIGAVGPRGPPA